MDDKLYSVINYVLNEADDAEIKVILEAVKKRADRKISFAPDINPNKIAKNLASQISGQIGGSVDQIRDMVRGFVVNLIKENAPDIPQEHLDILLKEWVPEPSEMQKQPRNSNLAPDVLLTMIRQFVAFSTENMDPGEQIRLDHEIPEWKELYWSKFPDMVRKLIKLLLDGQISVADFWDSIKEVVENQD